MMRKFNKKKSGRRGAILVTVVFVLAFAAIFIAAAMTLTQATRKRVYREAENDQARLTVTSVAEAWYRAIDMCEFDDDVLLAMCTGGDEIHVRAPNAASRIPGLEVGSENNPNNRTTVKFSKQHTGVGSTDDKYTYYADFTTTIDGHSENVRAVLTYTLPANEEGGKPFTAQFDFNNQISQTNMTDVGKGAANDAENIFLARHGGKNNNHGWSVYSTMIYCDGYVSFKDDHFYSEDMVFLTGAKFKETGDDTQPKVMNVKNFFFFGKNDEEIADGPTTHWQANSSQTFYLCNRHLTTFNGNGVKNWQGSANIEYVTTEGKRVSDGTGPSTLSTDIKNKIIKYASYNVSYSADGTEQFPTTDKFLKSAKNLGIYRTAPNGSKEMKLGDFFEAYCYQKTSEYVPANTYLFTEDNSDNKDEDHSYSGITFGDKEPYVMVLSGSSSYKFYFKAGEYFSLRNVVFIVDKPNTSNPVVFILEKGAKVFWAGSGNKDPNNWTSNVTSNTYVGSNGIISNTGRSFDDKEQAYNFAINEYKNGLNNKDAKKTVYDHNGQPQQVEKGVSDLFDREPGDTGDWSKAYNGTNEVSAYVIGMGKNTFALGKNMVVEAFVGLFNDEYGKGDPSQFCTYNSKSSLLYGRLMTDGYEDNDGGGVVMPASPGSAQFKTIDPGFHKAVTNFRLVNMIYYYNLDEA